MKPEDKDLPMHPNRLNFGDEENVAPRQDREMFKQLRIKTKDDGNDDYNEDRDRG